MLVIALWSRTRISQLISIRNYLEPVGAKTHAVSHVVSSSNSCSSCQEECCIGILQPIQPFPTFLSRGQHPQQTKKFPLLAQRQKGKLAAGLFFHRNFSAYRQNIFRFYSTVLYYIISDVLVFCCLVCVTCEFDCYVNDVEGFANEFDSVCYACKFRSFVYNCGNVANDNRSFCK